MRDGRQTIQGLGPVLKEETRYRVGKKDSDVALPSAQSIRVGLPQRGLETIGALSFDRNSNRWHTATGRSS